jgi:hypothetical protein
MMNRKLMIAASFAALLGGFATPSFAQDEGAIGEGEDVVVTGSRIDRLRDDGVSVPTIGLTRRADFYLQTIVIVGDTRDQPQRRDEMLRMMRAALDRANASGLRISMSEEALRPITAADIPRMSFFRDSRPDAERLSFLVKLPLTATMTPEEVESRITNFIRSVQPVGRAVMERAGGNNLSVIRPEQYRSAIIGAIAADGSVQSRQFGEDYGVEAFGLQRPVEWSRSGSFDVFLYIPYQLNVVPR